MRILDKIIANKIKEVALSKKRLPLAVIKRKLSESDCPARILRKSARLQLIAEIKPKSPSAGVIRKGLNAAKLAEEFENRGASAISVLTDKKYFGGSLKNLSEAKKTASLPILRKDFIFDPYQFYESRLYGADLALLIAGVIKNKIKEFVKLANELKLQALIEVHDAGELKSVLKLVQPSEKIIIGVNSRDLKTFKVDLNTSLRLVKIIPKKFIKVSESGVSRIHQLKKLSSAGFDAVLIGQGLVENPGLFNYFK